MGEYFLKNCVSFTPGINPSRIQTTDLEFYDQNDFVNDYNFINKVNIKDKSFDSENLLKLKEGDVVISVVTRQAAIVSKGNDGKILTLNFIKVDFDNDFLDKNIFYIYLILILGLKGKKKECYKEQGLF